MHAGFQSMSTNPNSKPAEICGFTVEDTIAFGYGTEVSVSEKPVRSRSFQVSDTSSESI